MNQTRPYRINWSDVYFSASGRIGQVGFIIGVVSLWVGLALFQAIVQGDLRFLGWVFYPGLIGSASCVLSKRLHDRGRSGWWATPIIIAFIMVWPIPKQFLDFLGVLMLLWTIIDLGFMPGERGENRYGPNPLGPSSTTND